MKGDNIKYTSSQWRIQIFFLGGGGLASCQSPVTDARSWCRVPGVFGTQNAKKKMLSFRYCGQSRAEIREKGGTGHLLLLSR